MSNIKISNVQFLALLYQNGYQHVRKLPTGEYAAIMPMLFTVGLFTGLTRTCWRTCWCYESYSDAYDALKAWDGEGNPLGLWIK